ncbi:hypothetical protein PYCC9005_001518 [Savitreella phatthalungensis]
MGLIDKLKGHKKEESFDDVAARQQQQSTGKSSKRRSLSLGRKSSKKLGAKDVDAVPPVPTEGTTATYPVDGTHGVESARENAAANSVAHSNGNTNPSEIPAASSSATPGAGITNAASAAKAQGSANEKSVDGITSGVHSLHIPASDPRFDRSKLSDTPFDEAAFFGDSQTTTDFQQSQLKAVIQQRIQPTVHEIVHPIFHHEHHVTHHQTRIQPVLEQVILPAKHFVIIEGKKYEILPEAVVNHVVVQREYIPMNVKPQVIVHNYVNGEPHVGPITGVGASPLNQDVATEHQRFINASYEPNAAAKHQKDVPAAVLDSRPAGQIVDTGFDASKIDRAAANLFNNPIYKGPIENLSNHANMTTTGSAYSAAGIHQVPNTSKPLPGVNLPGGNSAAVTSK